MNSFSNVARDANAKSMRPMLLAESARGAVTCDAGDPIGDPTPDDYESKCWLAGVCICDAPGQRLQRARNSLFRKLKLACPPGTPQRTQLVDGDVFLLLYNESFDIEAPDVAAFGENAFVLHISFQCLSPYRPTCQEMWVQSVEGDSCNIVHLEVSVFYTVSLGMRG